MHKTLTLGKIAELVGGELRGDPAVEIRSVAPLSSAGPGDLTWAVDRQRAAQLSECQASAVLLSSGLENGPLSAVVCDRPELGISKVLACFMPPLPHPPVGVDPTALIADGVTLGEETAIGPRVLIQRDASIGRRTKIHAGAVIAAETQIGDDCTIWPNVVIRERCRIGNRVVIHPNTTIGADGFGYNFDETHFQKIPHIGTVRIEDDVEIGANSCIDRGKYSETVIGRGTKIDNLVQIAHNVRIGENCCIVAHVGIAGSTELGDFVTLAGKVGVKDDIRIGNQVQAAACSCIAGDVEDGQIVLGIPAKPKGEFFREHLAVRRVPKALEDIRDLRKRIEQLEAANHQETS